MVTRCGDAAIPSAMRLWSNGRAYNERASAFISPTPFWSLNLHPRPISHRPRRTPVCKSPSPSFLTRIRSFLTLRLQRIRKAPPQEPPPTSQEWKQLVLEFEERSGARGIKPRKDSIYNPEQFEMLPYVECALMTALTTILWYAGRVLRLDSFLLLFYPLPCIYIASRWGLEFANYTLGCIIFFVFVTVGPLFSVLYTFNTGLLAAVYSRAIWWRLDWLTTLVCGAAAKAVGLCIQLAFITPILKYNAWKAVNEQVVIIVNGFVKLVASVGIMLPTPTPASVQIAIVAVISFHALYHVFFTLLLSTIFLRCVEEETELKRSPARMPLAEVIFRNARRRKR